MSETRPRRATIMVSLSALAAGAAIAGGATILALPSSKNSPQVPLVMGYNGAGNNARQTDSPPSDDAAKALAASPGSSAPNNSSAPATSSSAPSSSAPPSSEAPPSQPSTPGSPPAPPPPAPTQPQAPPPPPPPQTDGSPDAAKAAEVVALVNQARNQFVPQCGELTVNSQLATAAQRHSADMARRGYFSHTTPEGKTFDQRIREAGYSKPGGENIAKGQRTAQQVMESWMRSDGHRRNILKCEFKTIGVGVDTNGFVWTQNFGF